MRRRRTREEVSLFAFQDVMAAVVGILFFVVLLVALSIVETPAAAEPDPQERIEAARARRSELDQEIEQLRRRIGELNRALAASGASPQGAVGELHALHGTLSALHESIRRALEARQVLEERAAAADAEVAPTRARLRTVEGELAETLEAERVARSAPRVTYLLDRGPGTPEPWLVELTSTAITVASEDGASALFEFGGPDTETRRQRFLGWARTQDPARQYFVLLIKPSALQLAEELQSQLKELGFQIGTDLLPSSWDPFERPR